MGLQYIVLIGSKNAKIQSEPNLNHDGGKTRVETEGWGREENVSQLSDAPYA